MRFDDVTYGPWAMAIAATGDPSLAERRGNATAEEARAIGIGQVFAPVADVNVNPDNPVINVRSFGEDPADVSRYVVATVHGLQSGNVLATLKHFPGHGDTASDSHRSLATVAGRPRAPRVRRARPVPRRHQGGRRVRHDRARLGPARSTRRPRRSSRTRRGPSTRSARRVEVETGRGPGHRLGARS